jgi:hypothetical protein
MAFRKPKKNKIGGKFLVMGFEGSGKSYFGLTFPNSACVDSECGLAFYEDEDVVIGGKSYNNMKEINTTANLDELEESLDSIIEGDMEGIDTLVIDSETKFYISMDIASSEVEEKKAKQKGKEVDTRAKWGRVKQISAKLQQAKISASAKGVNVVSVAQAKEIKEEKTDKVIGYKPDCHASLPFDYDVILRFYKTEENGVVRFFAEVRKDRTNTTKIGQIIENATYDIWKDKLEGRKGTELESTNYSADIKKSVNSVMAEAELQEELAKTIIDKMKKAGKENSPAIMEKIKELGLDIKTLSNQEVQPLKALDEFLNTL